MISHALPRPALRSNKSATAQKPARDRFASEPFGESAETARIEKRGYRRAVFFGCSLMMFVISSPECMAQGLAKSGIKATRDIAYVEDGHPRQRLDLYVPQSTTKHRPKLVVWIHGGGWAKGSKSGIGNCRWILEHGFALASIGYRLTDTAPFPAQLDDCRDAIVWLRENESEYGYDASSIVVWGASAGGNLVSLLGTCDHQDPKIKPAGVIDWFGPSELLTMQVQRTLPTPLNADAPDSFESKLVGGPLQQRPEIARSASPVTHVTPDDSPFLIMHGDQDALVSLTQSRTLAKSLEKAGVPVELKVLSGAGHGGPAFGSPSSRNTILEFIQMRTR